MGMATEALGHARLSLTAPKISIDEFYHALNALLAHGVSYRAGKAVFADKTWPQLVEAALARFKPTAQSKARNLALWFYANSDLYEKAAQLIVNLKVTDQNLATALRVMLELDRKAELVPLEKRAAKLLARCDDDVQRSDLAAALTQSAWYRGDYAACIGYAEHIVDIAGFSRESLILPVMAWLAETDSVIEAAVQKVTEAIQSPPPPDDTHTTDRRAERLLAMKSQLLRIKGTLNKAVET